MANTSNKRSQAQRAADLVLIEKLHRQGKNQYEIADILSAQRPYSLSREQIKYDLEQLKALWQKEALVERSEAIAEELSEIKVLQKQYYDAWEKSLTERVKTRTRRGSRPPLPATDGKPPKQGGETTEASVEREQREGNPAFLAGVQWCIERRIKLRGLDAPTRIANTDPSGEQALPIIIVQPGYMDLI